MATLRIQLFGKFTVCCDGRELGGLDAGKSQELLCYLLVNRDRPHPRETLAGLLWGDASTERSKKYLRQALWHLQGVLDAGGESTRTVLRADHDWVQLDERAEVWLDVGDFERAFDAARGERGKGLEDGRADELRAAIELYRGDLLEGWYQDWCLFERERLQNMYLLMLDKLMSHCEAREDLEAGQHFGGLILRHDRAREGAHRRLMRLHHLAGDRTAALRQYERCVTALREELGVAPDRHTVALYREIRSDAAASAAPPPAHTEPPAQPDAADAQPLSLSDVLGRLKQLQHIVSDAQHRIQQDIKTVEHALRRKSGRAADR
jgi:DNA-binding SARP family transcriptional activator